LEELKKKYQYARKAWDTLNEVLKEDFSSVVRDAAIQRFEYTFETTWKVLKVYLKEREGIIANSPKSVFREALSVGILDANHTELALEMTDDRNLTSHTYLEQVAQQIFEKLPAYRDLMNQLLMQIDALR